MSDEEGSGGLSIKAWVDLAHHVAKTLDSYGQYISDMSASMKRYDQMIMRPVSQSATLSSTGFAIIDLGSPGHGFEWIVRLVVVSDAALWSNSMGSATVQFGKGEASPVPNTPMPAPTTRWPFTVVPNTATFGKNEFYIGTGDRLYCQVQNGNAGQLIQATAEVEQWPVSMQPHRTG